MARFTRDLVLNKPDDFVQFIMNDFLQKNQFEMSDWKGEAAYRAGDAMVEGFKYLKWSYNGGVFHLEAWLKSVGGGEMDLFGDKIRNAGRPVKVLNLFAYTGGATLAAAAAGERPAGYESSGGGSPGRTAAHPGTDGG